MTQGDPPRSKDGSKILRHVASDDGYTPPVENRDWAEAIEAHMTEHVGEAATVFHEIVSDKVHLDVHVIPPGADRAFWTLFTTGMSGRPMTVPEEAPGSAYAELSILLPPTWRCDEASWKDDRWYWPTRWLKTLARLPHDYKTWLGFGHTVPNGDPARPFDASTKLSGMLVATSMSLDEDAHSIEVEGATIELFTLWPLYAEEMQFKLDHGMDALIEKLEAGGVSDVINPARPSVIPRKKRFGLF